MGKGSGKKFPSGFLHAEGRLASGQLIGFSCRPGEDDDVKEFLQAHVRTITLPVTGRVHIAHGGFGTNTRYDIVQHEYTGGGHGDDGGWDYVEVLEIKNPPDGRHGIVIHERTSASGSTFYEWETIEQAMNVFWKRLNFGFAFRDMHTTGLKRIVACGALTPWFYAIDADELVGDYAFPHGLQEDPVFRFGRQFVVFDVEGMPSVKVCMGARFFVRNREYDPNDYYSKEEKERMHYMYRLVYWDDGSTWNEGMDYCKRPRPLESDEVWIAEAMRRFGELLTGKAMQFKIEFTDGGSFVGKLVRPRGVAHCAEGRYYVSVSIDGEDKVEGWVEFKPKKSCPDVVQYVTERFAKAGKVLTAIEVKEYETKRKGKKWPGAFSS